MRRLMLRGAVLLTLVLAAGTGLFILPYARAVHRVGAAPEAGYSADFFLYVSPGAREAAAHGDTVTILVQPNNSGTLSDDPAVHRRDAWWTGLGRHGLADDLGVALLVPAFVRPAEDWQIYTHALDRDVMTTGRSDLARLDLQLIAMIDSARSLLAGDRIPTHPRVLMQGYSASGMFANRFTVLHPDRVMAVASGAPGGWPIAPVATWSGERLPYPAGISDVDSLTGRPFDSATYRAVPQLIVMGSLDDNDGLDFGDGWEKEASEQVERLFGETPLARWDGAKDTYRRGGANATFVLVPDVGHDRRRLQSYSTAFFRAILSGQARPES